MARDYGGAYDIDPQAYFTKEEIDEFAYDVADEVSEQLGNEHIIRVTDCYVEYHTRKDELFISLDCDFNFVSDVSQFIDMRVIRSPKGLYKLKPAFVNAFVSSFKRLLADFGEY